MSARRTAETAAADNKRMSTISPARADKRASYMNAPATSDVAGSGTAAPEAAATNNTSSSLGYGATLARRFSMHMSRSPSQPLDVDAKERKKQSRMSMPFGGLQPQPQRRASAHMALSGVEEADNGPEGDAYDYDETAEESLAAQQDEDVPLGNGTTVRRSGTLGDMPPSRAGARRTREVSMGAVSVGRAAGLSMSPRSSGANSGRRPSTGNVHVDECASQQPLRKRTRYWCPGRPACANAAGEPEQLWHGLDGSLQPGPG